MDKHPNATCDDSDCCHSGERMGSIVALRVDGWGRGKLDMCLDISPIHIPVWPRL